MYRCKDKKISGIALWFIFYFAYLSIFQDSFHISNCQYVSLSIIVFFLINKANSKEGEVCKKQQVTTKETLPHASENLYNFLFFLYKKR